MKVYQPVLTFMVADWFWNGPLTRIPLKIFEEELRHIMSMVQFFISLIFFYFVFNHETFSVQKIEPPTKRNRGEVLGGSPDSD